MRSLLAAIAASLLILFAHHDAGRAAVDAAAPQTAKMELLVFEHAACTYCQIFRRDVLPRYRAAVTDHVPLRFIDIAQSDTDRLDLKSRIDTLPTVVVMRDGSEVDRIVGYWGPDNFFKLLTHILNRYE